MAELAQLEAALVKADAAGNTDDARAFASEIRRMRATPQVKGVQDTSSREAFLNSGLPPVKETGLDFPMPGVGTAEAALAVGSGMAGMAASPIVAGLRRLAGTGSTERGPNAAGNELVDIARNLTYEPRTIQGRGQLEQFSGMMDASRLAGLNPSQGMTVAGVAPQALRRGINEIPGLPRRESPAMAGVGAAMTDEARLRSERAAALPVPIQLTKGQATRTFEQQQFEREAAKNPEAGIPLRERFTDQNAKILQNFDAWVDQTGAESGGNLRATGQIVTDAIANKAKMAKGHIKAAYDSAKARGETQAPVSLKPLSEYVASHEPEAINAPVISSVAAKLKTIENNGAATLNDIEEVRKMIGNLSGKDATNAHYGKELKLVIDQMTEGVGGEAYKRARALRTRYAKEFEDVGVIDKMMRTKPGTSDRAVAYEDVFNHSILSGSLDDVRSVRKTLQTAGKDGLQAWRELQGQTVQHIKDTITKNVATDELGNPVVSAAALNKLVSDLDKDGKLDFIFGKKGGEQIREVNAIAKDVLTSPLGSVNHSNTASILAAMVDTALTTTFMLPLPVATATKVAFSKLKSRSLNKRVTDSLSPQ